MPCDSIITQSVDISKCGDAVLLSDAVSKVDMQGCRLINGTVVGNQAVVGTVADSIKREYSKASVYASAKKMGWLVREVGPNKLQVYRRS